MTTLTDTEIRQEIEAGRLLDKANPQGASGACYELRMGDVYYDLSEGGKRFAIKPGEAVLIKPGHRVVLITAEVFDVPNDILVRVISKGSLFSIGLSPVATYADPGFKGNLGIVTQNTSDKYIELPQGEPIAKADFTRLSGEVSTPYHGQHGFQVGIWPIKEHLQKQHADVAQDKRVHSEREEALALLPAATRTIIKQIERTQTMVNVGLVAAILLNSAALVAIGAEWMSAVIAVILNLASTAIVGIGALIVNYKGRT